MKGVLALAGCGGTDSSSASTAVSTVSSASQAGVIFPLESVSATVFGCIFLHEIMQGVQIAGSILILLSIIISSVEFKKND